MPAELVRLYSWSYVFVIVLLCVVDVVDVVAAVCFVFVFAHHISATLRREYEEIMDDRE